jgi:hypothetical protein
MIKGPKENFDNAEYDIYRAAWSFLQPASSAESSSCMNTQRVAWKSHQLLLTTCRIIFGVSTPTNGHYKLQIYISQVTWNWRLDGSENKFDSKGELTTIA